MGGCLSTSKRVSVCSGPATEPGSTNEGDARTCPRYLNTRRGSVSAEPGKQPGGAPPLPVHAKDAATRAKLEAMVSQVLLFKELDSGQRRQLVDAMVQRHCSAGEVVIAEGQEGDFFYVVEQGRFVATQAGTTKFVYEDSGSFGELALLYNFPRAATVTAVTGGVLWAVDRSTFRFLVVGGMESRRARHEAFLRNVPVLAHLTPEQLAAVADCLVPVSFTAGDTIIQQGQEAGPTAKFYIVESGRVDCFRAEAPGGPRQLTRSLQAGDVFGEVALLTNEPRQADCVAGSQHVQCLAMGRDAFERLMGPVESSLGAQIQEYRRMNQAAATPPTTAVAPAAPPAAAT